LAATNKFHDTLRDFNKTSIDVYIAGDIVDLIVIIIVVKKPNLNDFKLTKRSRLLVIGLILKIPWV
jgi:hypothetical protein